MGNKNCPNKSKSEIESLKNEVIQHKQTIQLQDEAIQQLRKEVHRLNNSNVICNGYASPSCSSYSLLPRNLNNSPSFTPLSAPITKDNNSHNSSYMHSIETCQNLHDLAAVMKRYDIKSDENDEIFDTDTIQATTNNFIHLTIDHNSDTEFEFIMHTLGHCNLSKCKIIKRNFRFRKSDYKKLKRLYCTGNPNKIAYRQIYDKIHCHYLHCYDIGNKLSFKHRRIIEEQTKNSCCLNFYGKNTKLLEILKRSSRKSKQSEAILDELANRSKKIFGMYSFGRKIDYWYDSENHESGVSVRKKYNDIKEELLNNPICCISKIQFDVELEKANIKYNSSYRTQVYGEMSINHTLALMLYCNHTALQYQLSKTYWENIDLHENFFHWAKSLKEAVKKFGTEILRGKIKSFYHGIGQKLLPPSIVTDTFIYCPLSTSSSIEVATHFACNTDGLVFEFKGGGKLQQVKYFSMSWLSDFNESECLFIQNYHTLKIANICDLTTGCEYRNLLSFLQIIDEMICEKEYEQKIQQYEQKFIKTIILNQIRKTWTKKSLPRYGQQLINVYFHNRKKFIINQNCKNKLFFYELFELPKLDLVHLLCPNIHRDDIVNISTK